MSLNYCQADIDVDDFVRRHRQAHSVAADLRRRLPGRFHELGLTVKRIEQVPHEEPIFEIFCTSQAGVGTTKQLTRSVREHLTELGFQIQKGALCVVLSGHRATVCLCLTNK
ncbi:MAG: hypothetical protein JWM68_1889 [Verrucomicrobiales bacterium]|nr:hypothetical protein [Verrucomicrobiales bacterium]